MSVIYKCNYCGRPIKSGCNYEGPVEDFPEYIKSKTAELSDKCECRKGKLMTIAEKIEIYRKSLNLSQKELARKSGLSPQAICQYENGKRIPDLKSFIAVCNALGVSMDRFMENVTI